MCSSHWLHLEVSWNYLDFMMSRYQFEVLKEFRLVARTLAIYNLDNYFGVNNKNRHKLKWNIFATIVFTISYGLLTGLSLIDTWFATNSAIEWNIRIYNSVVVLALTHQLLIFISTNRVNRQIFNTLNDLQRIVNGSKWILAKFGHLI